MYNPIIEFLINGGVDQNTIWFALAIPIIAIIINISRYIVGIKSFSIYATVGATFLMYMLGSTFTLHQNPNIWIGLAFGWAIIMIVLCMTTIWYSINKNLKLHYFPKITTVLIGVSISLLFLIFIGVQFNIQVVIQLSPISIVLLMIVAEQILEIYLKKQFSTTLLITIETLVISSVSFIIIANETVKYFFFNYPYLIIILIVGNILIGMYTGLRISEYRRFYELLIDKNENEDTRNTEK